MWKEEVPFEFLKETISFSPFLQTLTDEWRRNMKWSKLKKLTQDRFDDSLKGRVTLNSTRYGNCTCGHAWLCLDGTVIANFCTRAYWNRKYYDYEQECYWHSIVTDEESRRYMGQYVEYGEQSRQDFYRSCWLFVHELNIDQSLASSNPMIQSLAVIDRRLGKRRLQSIDTNMLHPLARKLIGVRLCNDNSGRAQSHG